MGSHPASPEHAASAEHFRVTLYEYHAWFEFLLPACLPGSLRLEVRLGESAEEVLARLDPACSLFVFHVDLTQSLRVPLDRAVLVAQLRARGIAVCNPLLTDISKHRVHDLCIRAGLSSPKAPLDGDPDERLVLKTTYNCFGYEDAALTVLQRQILGYAAPYDIPQRPNAKYRLVQRRDVPQEIWTSPHWVVERYISNKKDRFHRVYIAGNAMVISRVFDPSTFKKMPEGIERESFYMKVGTMPDADSIPGDIAAVAARCSRIVEVAGIDFAALDVVGDDHDTFYVIDINPTPFWGSGGHPTLLNYLGTGLMDAYCGN